MQSTMMPLRLSSQSMQWAKTGAHIFLGALYVACLAQVTIPLKPIPITMQTFAVFSLALFQGSWKSCLSLLLYLFAATMGLPVLAGMSSNPLWMFSPSVGYCLSFPIAAYFIGKSTEIKQPSSAVWMIMGLCAGQLSVFLLGVMGLSLFIGWEPALVMGLYPFILFDGIKLLAAFSVKMAANCKF